jgi:hypothetical protein
MAGHFCFAARFLSLMGFMFCRLLRTILVPQIISRAFSLSTSARLYKAGADDFVHCLLPLLIAH